MNKSFLLPSSAGCLTEGEKGYISALRIKPKRGDQWFMDASKPELFSNKRKSVESINNVAVSVSSINVSPCENTSGLQAVSGKLNSLSGSEAVRTINPFDMNKNMGRKDLEDHFKNEFSVGLSMPHEIEAPLSSLNRIEFKKVKVNEVCDPENCLSVTTRHPFSKGDNNTISVASLYNKSDNCSTLLAPACNCKDKNTISVGPIFKKTGENSSSQGNLSSKGDDTFILMGHTFSKGDKSILSMGQNFNKGIGNFISMGQTYGKKDGNIISMGCTCDKAHADFILPDLNYNQENENFVSFGPSYNKTDESSSSKVDERMRLMSPTYGKVDTGIPSNCAIYDKGVYDVSMGQKGIVSFGGFNNELEVNSSENIISSNNLLISQSSAQALEAVSQKDLVESISSPIAKSSPNASSKTNAPANNKKAKSSKQVPANNFPLNAKVLLSTGVFDGVPVKYVSWKRDKSLRGVIEGTGYKCSCKECNHTKSFNAFEFECHADFKTTHPNRNIFFANGKSVYAVVQELKNTPPEKLFEAIQNVTGSPINQKNFHSWKESFKLQPGNFSASMERMK